MKSSIKVKGFERDNINSLAYAIGEFLNNNDIEIISLNYSTGIGKETCLILFKDK